MRAALRIRGDDRACCCRPPSGGALANIGVSMAGKVPVNLNFTAGQEAMASAAGAVRDPHDRDLEGVPGQGQASSAMEGMVYRRRHSGGAGQASPKLRALAAARLLPARAAGVRRAIPMRWRR